MLGIECQYVLWQRVLGFLVFWLKKIGHFLGQFYQFCTEKLRFSVVCCSRVFFRFLASGFRFLAKMQVFFLFAV